MGASAGDIEFAPKLNRDAISDMASAADYCQGCDTHLVVFAPEVRRYSEPSCAG